MRRKFDSCQGYKSFVVYNYCMETITCKDLWKELMVGEPDSQNVVVCKERLSTYSKDDWSIMAKEATDLTVMLGELVKYNIPVESKLAENGFDALIKHFHDWFFTIDKNNAEKLAFICSTHPRYIMFFDGYYPGLSKYIGKIGFRYSYKLTK
jgi:hypothetical protein